MFSIKSLMLTSGVAIVAAARDIEFVPVHKFKGMVSYSQNDFHSLNLRDDEEPIGQGKHGKVYYGDYDGGEKNVVVKVYTLFDFDELPDEDADLREKYRTFIENEFIVNHHMTVNKPHPSITKCVGMYMNELEAIIVMKQNTGKNVAELLGSRELAKEFPLKDKKIISSQFAAVLAHLHESNIIVHDLSIENAMYDQTTEVLKIFDFFYAQKDHKIIQGVYGNPLHYAPEVADQVIRNGGAKMKKVKKYLQFGEQGTYGMDRALTEKDQNSPYFRYHYKYVNVPTGYTNFKGHGDHSFPVDVWSLGMVVWEVFVGESFFRAHGQTTQEQKISAVTNINEFAKLCSKHGTFSYMTGLGIKHSPNGKDSVFKTKLKDSNSSLTDEQADDVLMLLIDLMHTKWSGYHTAEKFRDEMPKVLRNKLFKSWAELVPAPQKTIVEFEAYETRDAREQRQLVEIREEIAEVGVDEFPNLAAPTVTVDAVKGMFKSGQYELEDNLPNTPLKDIKKKMRFDKWYKLANKINQLTTTVHKKFHRGWKINGAFAKANVQHLRNVEIAYRNLKADKEAHWVGTKNAALMEDRAELIGKWFQQFKILADTDFARWNAFQTSLTEVQ